jgi:hypothetical protein
LDTASEPDAQSPQRRWERLGLGDRVGREISDEHDEDDEHHCEQRRRRREPGGDHHSGSDHDDAGGPEEHQQRLSPDAVAHGAAHGLEQHQDDHRDEDGRRARALGIRPPAANAASRDTDGTVTVNV